MNSLKMKTNGFKECWKYNTEINPFGTHLDYPT